VSYKADNSIFDKVTLPTVTDGTLSRSFSAPNGAKVLTIHNPTLTGSATLAIQVLDPQDSDQAAENWRQLKVLVIAAAAAAYTVVDAIPTGSAVTIPVAALGGGIFRFVASAAQTGAPDNGTILIRWGLDG